VDGGSGVLYTARQIDRDVVCRDVVESSVCRLTLDVALLRPLSLFRVLQVHVDLLDINDNDPAFNVDSFLLTVPESVAPGKQVCWAWNSLALSLRTCTSPDTLRRYLKTHYCQQAFQST